jgi:hypothetical protein
MICHIIYVRYPSMSGMSRFYHWTSDTGQELTSNGIFRTYLRVSLPFFLRNNRTIGHIIPNLSFNIFNASLCKRKYQDEYDMPTITIQQFEQASLIICCSFLILFMLFILYRLSKDSNAGKYGMFVIFFALSLGIFGFAMKSIIHLYLI